MKTLVIVPTYNELENLPLLLKEVFSNAPATDVLVVNDNSPDGTGALADKMSAEVYPRPCIASQRQAWSWNGLHCRLQICHRP